jgi:hypothetical protein
LEFYSQTYRPISDLLVELPSHTEGYYNTRIGDFVPPPPIFGETANLVTQGYVVKTPANGALKELEGKEIVFNYVEAHKALKGRKPSLDGHILVSSDNIILNLTDNRMVGEWISCEPIAIPETPYKLIDATYKETNDTGDHHFAQSLTFREKGVVNIENDFYPMDTPLFFTDSKYVHTYWPYGGMLILNKYVLAYGQGVENMTEYRKKTKTIK